MSIVDTRSDDGAARKAPVGERMPIRVMVVDDSRVVRSIVGNWLDEAPDMTLVAAHGDGSQAAGNVAQANPDVVILDIEMPGMDGLTALPLILKRRPRTRVLVVSTLTRRGAAVSLEALTLGAADYVAKPDAGLATGAATFRSELLAKIRVLAGHRPGVAEPPSGRQTPEEPDRLRPLAPTYSKAPATPDVAARPAPAPAAVRRTGRPEIVVIGSSTGGPQALMDLFKALGPAMGRAPVLVAQHMPATFTAILAEHIARVSGRPAMEGIDNEPLRPGEVRVAPGGRHMSVARGPSGPIVRLLDTPPVNFCKPSADVLFSAASTTFANGVLAVVLTGMGSDGADGARAIFQAGGTVIAQDEATSVVWGMPRAVVEAGAASEVLPLERIGPRSAELLSGHRA